MSASKRVQSCLNILRRTPPGDSEQNLSGLVSLLSHDEDAADKLMQSVDAALKHDADQLANRKLYILCDHNRDGDSYRSPWSNTYHPPLDDGLKPSDGLRELEVHANEIFDSYRELYYGKQAISSVYLWDLDGSGGSSSNNTSSFAGCFLIKKVAGGDQYVKDGFWNSIHVVHVGAVKGGKSAYTLTTTVLFSVDPTEESLGEANLSGTVSRQTERDLPVTDDSTHIVNIGKLIEDVEIDIRSSMDAVYIQKTKEVLEDMRAPAAAAKAGQHHAMMLNQAVLARGASNRNKSCDEEK